MPSAADMMDAFAALARTQYTLAVSLYDFRPAISKQGREAERAFSQLKLLHRMGQTRGLPPAPYTVLYGQVGGSWKSRRSHSIAS